MTPIVLGTEYHAVLLACTTENIVISPVVQYRCLKESSVDAFWSRVWYANKNKRKKLVSVKPRLNFPAQPLPYN